MDEQTMRDYIEDLLQERANLYERIRKLEENRDQWQALTMKWQEHSTELMGQLDRIRIAMLQLGGAHG
jgi:hypothetical protein